VSGRVRRRAELGQHFLSGGWLAAELVEQAGVSAGDLVVEIGAGTGVLTEALARRAGRVVAVECDPGWPSGPGCGSAATGTSVWSRRTR
jgi:16S rRNA A1518/A1519 N6-dimethyltransferase RsmA/KsgA/DIM1 with predicted DNA glycosylase/AP lyase activity